MHRWVGIYKRHHPLHSRLDLQSKRHFLPSTGGVIVGILLSILIAYGTYGQGQESNSSDKSLIGYWKLQDDARDYSGKENHGINHGVNFDTGEFNGRDAWIEVPDSPSLRLGTEDFTFSAWVHTKKELDDVIGDIFSKYDRATRRGVNLSIKSSAGGYQSQGDDRQVHFGIDNDKQGEWQDCGHPSPTSNYASNTVVYKGKLYAAIFGAKEEQDWAHVFRYEGGQRWTDCGRLGTAKTTGVGPMIVHDGQLYAATGTYDWTRVSKEENGFEFGSVYRFEGIGNWVDCGHPGQNRRIPTMASFQGRLYAGAGNENSGIYAYEGGKNWKLVKEFPADTPKRLFPHGTGIHDGKLFVGFPGYIYSFDGKDWRFEGNPVHCTQIHSVEVYRGQMYVGTWPEAKIGRYLHDGRWEYAGRIGEDGTEVNALLVHNGQFVAGSIPRAEFCRYDGENHWTSLHRFFLPPNPPIVPFNSNSELRLIQWSRITSLNSYDGHIYATIASCNSAPQDAPADVRGKIFSIELGKSISNNDDIGPGWKHITSIREKGHLKLYIDGELVATSSNFQSADYDLSTTQALRIGFGEIDYFSGKIREAHLYNKALTLAEIRTLAATRPAEKPSQPTTPLKAGAATSNITPWLDEPIVGNWKTPPAHHIHDELHARCLVLDNGAVRIAIVIVDSVGVPAEVLDQAKRQIQEHTGLPVEHILIASTHTHSATSARWPKEWKAGSEFDAYQKFLAHRIADGVRRAINNLQPARIGWGTVKEPLHVTNRRRYYNQDSEIPANPFGGYDKVKGTSVQRDLKRSPGSIDPEIAFVSVQTTHGRPIAVLANYSMHYVGQVEPDEISADYFGAFADRIQELLGANHFDPPFVGILSNGTSGDIDNPYDNPPGHYPPYERMRYVANDIAQQVFEQWDQIEYHYSPSLGMIQRTLELAVRKPTPDQLKKAQEIVANLDRPDQFRHERVYAQRLVNLAEAPNQVSIILQTLRIGDLGIASVPFEAFAETGLEIKEKSPFRPTFTVELANGSYGYLPPPRQHELGGYETWLGTNLVEIDTSTKMTKLLLEMFRELKSAQ